MSILARSLTAIATILFVNSAFAASYFVKDTAGSGVPDEKIAVKELVSAAVSQVKGNTTTEKESGADFVLEPRLVRLGAAYILYVNKTKGGQTIFSQQSRANTFDDIDTVATRVVRAVITEVEVKQDKKVSEVTEDEVTRGMRRREATRQWMLGFGPGWIGNVGESGSGVEWLISYLWGVSPETDIQLGIEGLSIRDSVASISNLFLGVNYHLSQAETAPYLSASFGHGSASIDDNDPNTMTIGLDDASGFTLSVGGGVKFFRSSKVNLALGAKAVYLFDKGPYGNPTGYLSYLAVCF